MPGEGPMNVEERKAKFGNAMNELNAAVPPDLRDRLETIADYVRSLEDDFAWLRIEYLSLADHHEGTLAELYPDEAANDPGKWDSRVDLLWQNRVALGAEMGWEHPIEAAIRESKNADV